jgi:polyribonucleotide nucleotidyltransferase
VVGETYEGVVKSTTQFGAFVEIMPGTEGLVHISELKHGRTEKTEDVVKKGERVKVKLIDRDERGRLRLSMKALVPKPEGVEDAPAGNGNGNGERAPRAEGSESSSSSSEGGEGGSEPRRERSERPRRPRSGGRSRE